MDWRSITFDWNRVRAFLVTAEEGSLSAAARALNMTQPTLGRQVAALESELEVLLFDRVGRSLRLTPDGRELLEHVRLMGEGARLLSVAASGRSRSLEGTVRVTAIETIAVHWLPPLVVALRRSSPTIAVEVTATDEALDLGRREADIAIRTFRPSEPDLIARRLREVLVFLYATPAYLESVGSPASTADLADADFVGYDGTDSMEALLATIGVSVTSENFPVRAQGHLVQWEHVKHGLGIGPMFADIGDAEPRVVRVLKTLEPLTFELWLATHRELRTNRRIRTVFDAIAHGLASA